MSSRTHKEDVMRKQFSILSFVLVLSFGLSAFAQENAAPGKTAKSTVLIFREDFKADKVGEVQLNQSAIVNPNVELKMYGPGSKIGKEDQSGLLLSNEADPVNPGKTESIVWTGVAEATWGVTLKDKNNFMDLRDTARLHWRTRSRSL